MGKIKAKISVVAIVAILLTFIVHDSYAYFSTVGKSANVVTSGDIKMIIHEETDAGTDFPKEGVYIVPGDIVSKQVSIENACDHPFYLRVKIVYGVGSQELSAEDCFKLNINENCWEYHDGWYYYKKVVKPHKTTENVFSHVEIVGSKVDNSYIGQTLTLTVDAEAVQSENNKITDGKVYTALGWPAQ